MHASWCMYTGRHLGGDLSRVPLLAARAHVHLFAYLQVLCARVFVCVLPCVREREARVWMSTFLSRTHACAQCTILRNHARTHARTHTRTPAWRTHAPRIPHTGTSARIAHTRVSRPLALPPLPPPAPNRSSRLRIPLCPASSSPNPTLASRPLAPSAPALQLAGPPPLHLAL